MGQHPHDLCPVVVVNQLIIPNECPIMMAKYMLWLGRDHEEECQGEFINKLSNSTSQKM